MLAGAGEALLHGARDQRVPLGPYRLAASRAKASNDCLATLLEGW